MNRPALQLYRQLLQARRRFPADPNLSGGGLDMRALLLGRIRQEFVNCREVVEPQRRTELLRRGQEELKALETIVRHTYAKQFQRDNDTIDSSGQIISAGAKRPGSVRFSIFGKFWKS